MIVKICIAASLLIVFLAIMFISCAGNQGVAAPAFTLTDVTGNKVTLADYKGQKAVFLLFFNFNIGTGQDPVLQSYLKRYKGMQGLETYAVVNYAVLPEQGRQYMATHGAQNQGGLGYAIPLKDEDGTVSQKYGANRDKLTFVLINRDGFISFRQEVTSTADENTELARHIEEITK
jgi:peroxiredoxin